MDKVYVVFSVERNNPFSKRSIIGMTDTYGAARHMISLYEDSYIECVVQEWDISTMQDLYIKVPWYVTLWNGGDTFTVRRTRLSDNANAKHENKILTEDYNSHFVLVWANNKDEAIEEARRMIIK